MSDSYFEYFQALHSAVWNRNGRLSSIIYPVTVTSADFNEVQNRLNNHNPSRALDESIKLDVICDAVTRNKNSISSAGDVTFHVLDLRTLQLPLALFGMQVILAREEYQILAESIMKNRHSLFLTGQPGIG